MIEIAGLFYGQQNYYSALVVHRLRIAASAEQGHSPKSPSDTCTFLSLPGKGKFFFPQSLTTLKLR